MNEMAFEKKLDELVRELGTIPAPQKKKGLILLAKKTRDCQKQLEQHVNGLQESLDYLRVSIKYVLFDLESTRRENTYLRKILEEKNR
jgi:hypothetical protein